eukprot:gene36397-biopygen4201
MALPVVMNSVRLAIDREPNRPKRFAHIEFTTRQAAERAVKELNGMEVLGREMRADHATERDAARGGGRDRAPVSGRGDRSGGRRGGGSDRFSNEDRGGDRDRGNYGSW